MEVEKVDEEIDAAVEIAHKNADRLQAQVWVLPVEADRGDLGGIARVEHERALYGGQVAKLENRKQKLVGAVAEKAAVEEEKHDERAECGGRIKQGVQCGGAAG